MILKTVFLLPFSMLYGSVMACRNWLFDIGLLKSYRPTVPTLIVGNLSMGGSGKSPHVEYFIEKLQTEYKLAIVSRGYGRKTEGYRQVTPDSSAKEVGDEPLQIKQKFPHIPFSVCENRAEGIQKILAQHTDTALIILDDAMQHRGIKGGFVVMLSIFNHPFFKDWVVPFGNLREFGFFGKKRADCCVYTKCPDAIDELVKQKYAHEFSTKKQSFFSKFEYNSWELISCKKVDYKISKLILVSGIAYPEPLIKHLEINYSVESIAFGDHHEYSDEDILSIHRKFANFDRQNSAIVCTEKDAVKLKDIDLISQNKEIPWFSLPIRVVIENEQQLINQIHHYVTTYSGSRALHSK